MLTTNLIKENVNTILQIFPDHFIKACNKSENPWKEDWTREAHLGAHLAIKKINDNITAFGTEPTKFAYITEANIDDFVCIRADLFKMWVEQCDSKGNPARRPDYVLYVTKSGCIKRYSTDDLIRITKNPKKFESANLYERNGYTWYTFIVQDEFIALKAYCNPKSKCSYQMLWATSESISNYRYSNHISGTKCYIHHNGIDCECISKSKAYEILKSFGIDLPSLRTFSSMIDKGTADFNGYIVDYKASNDNMSNIVQEIMTNMIEADDDETIEEALADQPKEVVQEVVNLTEGEEEIGNIADLYKECDELEALLYTGEIYRYPLKAARYKYLCSILPYNED